MLAILAMLALTGAARGSGGLRSSSDRRAANWACMASLIERPYAERGIGRFMPPAELCRTGPNSAEMAVTWM